MANFHALRDKVIEEVAYMLCEEYRVERDEVTVRIDTQGKLKATITPNSFLEKINVSYKVVVKEK